MVLRYISCSFTLAVCWGKYFAGGAGKGADEGAGADIEAGAVWKKIPGAGASCFFLPSCYIIVISL